jgi:hypothetical protein
VNQCPSADGPDPSSDVRILVFDDFTDDVRLTEHRVHHPEHRRRQLGPPVPKKFSANTQRADIILFFILFNPGESSMAWHVGCSSPFSGIAQPEGTNESQRDLR